MPFIGHLPEVFIILLLALLVFGPKRMIEMGSSLGKAFRDFRESTRDIPGLGRITSLNGLLDDDEPRHTPFSTMSQFAQNATIEAEPEAPTSPLAQGDAHPAAPTASITASIVVAPTVRVVPVVDGSVEHAHTEERPRE